MLVDFRRLMLAGAVACARPAGAELPVAPGETTPAAALGEPAAQQQASENSPAVSGSFTGTWVVDLASPSGPPERVVVHLQGARMHIQLNRERNLRVLRYQALLVDGTQQQAVWLSARDRKAYVLDFAEYGAEVVGWLQLLKSHMPALREVPKLAAYRCAVAGTSAATAYANVRGCLTDFSAPWAASTAQRSVFAELGFAAFAAKLPADVWVGANPIWQVREQRPHPVADGLFAIPADYATVSLGQLISRLQTLGMPMGPL